MNEVIINGEKYVKQSASNNIVIAVLHRGFVYIGRLEKDDKIYTLKNAYNIRRWGTTKGLGELALEGPKGNTKLDLCGEVSFHEVNFINFIKCSEVWDDII